MARQLTCTKLSDKVISKLKELLDEVDVGKFCMCPQSFQQISTILSLNFVDNYKQVKDLLPQNSTITENSSKQDIARTIF